MRVDGDWSMRRSAACNSSASFAAFCVSGDMLLSRLRRPADALTLALALALASGFLPAALISASASAFALRVAAAPGDSGQRYRG
jgi:hypothetical protein